MWDASEVAALASRPGAACGGRADSRSMDQGRSVWSKLSGGAPDARARVEQMFSYSMRLSDNEEHIIPVSAFLSSDRSQRAVVSDQDSGFQQDAYSIFRHNCYPAATRSAQTMTILDDHGLSNSSLFCRDGSCWVGSVSGGGDL